MTHSPKPAEIWVRFEVARSDTLTLVAPNPVSSIFECGKLLTDAKEWTAVQTTSITQKRAVSGFFGRKSIRARFEFAANRSRCPGNIRKQQLGKLSTQKLTEHSI